MNPDLQHHDVQSRNPQPSRGFWGDRFNWLHSTARRGTGFLRRALEWIGLHELPVLLVTLVVILTVWGFAKIADEVLEGETHEFDEWAVRSLRQPDNLALPLGPEWLHEAGRDLTALGGASVLALLTASVAGFLWLRRMYGAMWLVVIATTGGLVASLLMKNLFDRPRPSLVPHLARVYTHSFPSGHAMLSAVVFLTLGALLGRFVEEMRLKAYFLLLAVMLTVVVGLSRIYMGVHYPTDVLAGWAAGFAWASACWLVAKFLQRRGAVERTTPSGDVVKAPDETA